MAVQIHLDRNHWQVPFSQNNVHMVIMSTRLKRFSNWYNKLVMAFYGSYVAVTGGFLCSKKRMSENFLYQHLVATVHTTTEENSAEGLLGTVIKVCKRVQIYQLKILQRILLYWQVWWQMADKERWGTPQRGLPVCKLSLFRWGHESQALLINFHKLT